MASTTVDPSSSGPTSDSQPLHPVSTRRNSFSSYSSDAHAPPPVGPMTLILHGNCARCHHHHSSASFRVNIPRNPKAATHVRCQNCNAKWLAIGGRSTTQLSMLSVETTRPDPRAAAVRYSLVDMVRSTTALAALSPVLAGIAEVSGSPGPSRQKSIRLPAVDATQASDPPIPQLVDTSHELEADDSSLLHLKTPQSFLTPSVVRPIANQKYGLGTKRHIAHLKESLGMRIPALHRANLKSRFGSIRQPKMSAKRWGKQPVRNPVASGSVTNLNDAPIEELSYAHGDVDNFDEPAVPDSGPVGTASAPIDLAVQFLEEISSDTTRLSSMDEKQRAAWVRAKYTEFKARFVDLAPPLSRTVPGSSADLSSQSPVNLDFNPSLGTRPPALAGVGSHLGDFDNAWPEDPSPRTSNFSISERISEAETAVEGANNVSTARHSLLEFLHRDRRGSGSPRPHSVSTFTTQRLRHNEPHVRFSVGSQVIGEPARRSFSRSRSAATDRYSQGSAPRSSLHLSLSQTSLTSLSVRS